MINVTDVNQAIKLMFSQFKQPLVLHSSAIFANDMAILLENVFKIQGRHFIGPWKQARLKGATIISTFQTFTNMHFD